MGRPPCCDKANVKRGLWTAEEDAKILAYVSNHGIGNWTQVPKKAGLNRCGKSCRLRWTNYLRPDLKHEEFTQQEEELIVKFHAAIGSRWSLIAKQLPGRTDNDVKNYWNTKLKKKLAKMGIDPMTHKPIVKIISDYETITSSTSNNPHIKDLNKNLTKVDENQIKNTNYLNSNLFLNQVNELDLIENGSFNHCSLEEISSSSSSSSSSSITNDKSSNLILSTGLSSTLINMKTSYNCMEPSLFNNSVINVDNKPMQCLRIGENYTDNCAGNDGNTTHVERKAAGSNDRSNFESSSVNSFVMAMLERDCQMQQEFSIFEDILHY